MSPRLAPALAASLVLLTVAACGASTGSPVASVASGPVPTPVVRPTPVFTAPTASTPSPGAGDVVEGDGPLLSIERVDTDTILATLDDPAAKAWRLVIAGVGERADDRLEIVVETGDVRPSIQATEIRDGTVVDVMDLSAFMDGTAAAGGCHRTLPVCVDSDGFRLPSDGDGTFAVRLTVLDPATPLRVTGATATWPAEPFVLGPWTATEAFPWGEG